MDWQAAIERHHAALMRVVAGFVAMVGAGGGRAADAAALSADRPTLSRHRHRALLRLVRPAEAAARRLVIALALAVAAPPEAAQAGRPVPAAAGGPEPGTPVPPGRPRRAHQPRQPEPTPTILRDGIGTGIVLPRPASSHPSSGHPYPGHPSSGNFYPGHACSGAPFPGHPGLGHPIPGAPGGGAAGQAAPAASATGGDPAGLPAWAAVRAEARPPRALRLPLTDPARRLRARRVALRDLPRIGVPGVVGPQRPPRRPVPAPHDRLDATRLVLRIRALASALDDLPGEAVRFRRWRTRHDAAVARAREAEAARSRIAAQRGPLHAVQRGPLGAAPHGVGVAARHRRSMRVTGVGLVPLPGGLGLAGAAAPAGPSPRFPRLSPLRSGRPPGGRRKPVHEVHAILAEAHDLACRALNGPDTS